VADRPELALLVEAEDQRADRALVLAGPPAHDDAVDRPHPLYLHHALALAGPIDGTDLLRDHALPAQQEGLSARRGLVERRDLDRARGALLAARRGGDQLLERGAALRERLAHQLAAVVGKQVEGSEERGCLL